MLSVDKLYNILENGYKPAVRSQIVYLLLGAPGIGKTQIVRKFAKDKGVNVVTLLCSQQLPNEIVGTHVPDLQGGTERMKYFPPSWYYDLKDGDILFLDEMLTAPKSVLAAMLTMIESRILQNSKTLPDVMIVAAANPTGSPAQVDAAIRDRFQVIKLDSDVTVAANYLADKYGGSSAWIAEFIDAKDIAEWNQMTPRTAEKLIIQMENMFDKEQAVTEDSMVMFKELYGLSNAMKAKQWWNDRAEKIRNKDFNNAVASIMDNDLESMRKQIKSAAITAAMNFREGTPREVKLEDLAGNEVNELGLSPDLTKKIHHMRLTCAGMVNRERLTEAEENELSDAMYNWNKGLVEEEVNEIFEEDDISTILGTLQNMPYWDNIRSILDGVKLVDVEV